MPSQVAARPEALQLSVEDLMQYVRAGKVRVPGFQRLYRWDAGDVCDLFDSIYKGYPVGTLLFWEREANAEQIKLSGVSIDAPKLANAWWVVDGQQRITSLANALLGDDGATSGSTGIEKKRRRYYAFNLETEKFVYTPRGEDGPPLLPLGHVLNSKSVMTWLSKNGVSNESQSFDRALEVNKLVRESRLNAYVLRNADEKYVRTVFDRINNFGKRLDDAEIFNSLHGGLTESRPNDLRQLSESLARIGFGQLPEQLVLRCLIAARGGDPTRMKDELRAARNAEAFESTERALAQALSFLKRDAEIPHFALLPYAVVPMMTLARFFHVFPEPKARTRELLRRWIYRGAISEAPSGNAAPKIRHALKAIVAGEEEISAQRLLVDLPGRVDLATLRKFDTRAAATRLVLLAMASLGPRDPVSGDLVDLTQLFERDKSLAIGNLFPHRQVGGDLFDAAAARVLYPAADPPRLLQLLSADDEIAASHAISARWAAAIRSGAPPHIETFVSDRATILRGVATTELERRARWGDSDRVSIAALSGAA